MCRIDITLWFALLNHKPFTEKFVNLRFVYIFNSFSCGNNETQACNLLIARWKPNLLAIQVCMAKIILFSFMESNVVKFESHHYDSAMCYILLCCA